MMRHPVSFENLADWLEGRLDPRTRQLVEEHLEHGCRTCESDLHWLRRMTDGLRSEIATEPPPELVARAKALYRSRQSTEIRQPRAWPLLRLPRLAMAGAALALVLAVVSVALTVVPEALAGAAGLTSLQGLAERSGASGPWQQLKVGDNLHSGDSLRVLRGTVVLTLFEGSTLELQPGARLTLSSLRSGLLGVAVRIAVSQEEGEVAYDVAAMRSPTSSFQVRSPAAVVTVRGTRFSLTVQSSQETKVEVFDGRVEVANEVTRQVLTQSQVAVVPVSAPLIHLPTLTPVSTPTPISTRMSTASPSDTVPPASAESSATPFPSLWTESTPHITSPSPVNTLTSVPSNTSTRMALPDLAPTELVSRTATITLTSEPRRTPLAQQVEFAGLIEKMPPSRLGLWLIGGRQVLVRPDTVITGRPIPGKWAKVQAWQYLLRPLEAIRIVVEDEGPVRTPEPGSTKPQPPPTTPQRPTATVPIPRTSTPWSLRTPATREPRPTWTPRATRTPRVPVVVPTLVSTPTLTYTPTAALDVSDLESNSR